MRTSTKVILIFASSCLLFAKLVYDLSTGATQGLNPNIANDAINFVWPYYNYASASIQSGVLPIWNPYSSVGAPFLGDLGLGMLYPINWLVFFIEVPYALMMIQLLTVAIGMAGMFAYLRYLGLAWPARALGVAIFAYALFTEAFHPALGSSLCWIPYALWLMHRLFDKPNVLNAVFVTLPLASCFLAGFPNFFVYTCLIVGVYGLTVLALSGTDLGVGGVALRIGLMIVALVFMLGLVAIQLLPAYELSTLSVRNIESGSAYNTNSFWESFSLKIMLKNFLLSNKVYFYANSAIEIKSGLYYLGGALLLLPFAVLNRELGKVCIALSGSFVFMCALMLSNQVPALSFFQDLPVVGSLRVNGRGVAYIQFLLIVLASVGLSTICRYGQAHSALAGSRFARVFAPLFVAYVSCLFLIASSISNNRWLYISLILCSTLLVFAAVRNSRAMLVGWLIAFFLIINIGAHRSNRFLTPAFIQQENGIIAEEVDFIRRETDHYRVLFVPDSLFDTATLANIGPLYQIPNISSYAGLTLARWRNFLRYLAGPEDFDSLISDSVLQRFYGNISPAIASLFIRDFSVLNLTSTRHVISATGNTTNMEALPRAYTVSEYIEAESELESLQAIKAHMPELNHAVVLENASPTFPSAPGSNLYGEVLITRYTSNQVELDVEVEKPSMVVLTDAFYPGWEAYVDGRKTAIYRANSMFRAVEVPPGKHSVVFQLSSGSFYSGLAITLFSTGLMVAIFIRKLVFTRRKATSRS